MRHVTAKERYAGQCNVLGSFLNTVKSFRREVAVVVEEMVIESPYEPMQPILANGQKNEPDFVKHCCSFKKPLCQPDRPTEGIFSIFQLFGTAQVA